MSDGLVKKANVLKVINAYFEKCIDHLESAEECLRALQYGLDLNILIEDLKEVKDEDYDLSGFCDKLWKSAYQKGHEDGRAERGCEGCKYIDRPTYDYPCSECSRFHLDYYDNTKGDSNG